MRRWEEKYYELRNERVGIFDYGTEEEKAEWNKYNREYIENQKNKWKTLKRMETLINSWKRTRYFKEAERMFEQAIKPDCLGRYNESWYLTGLYLGFLTAGTIYENNICNELEALHDKYKKLLDENNIKRLSKSMTI